MEQPFPGLFNNKINPALIDSGPDRKKYEFTTNNKDFILITKYRKETSIQKPDYSSWTFSNIGADILDLLNYIDEGKQVVLALILLKKDISKSELALLFTDDIKKCRDKKNITISRKQREHFYRISMGGGRLKSLPIPSDRLFTD